ncbi:TonB-dependent receptor [Massilia niastensis]|uniref:TonB-dependent receptor n=1 Tax=Massilia niastensis TaxID=544911 RepID=UPI001E5D83E7|nr:TonB-dependent receptor [Massilia niastensis]
MFYGTAHAQQGTRAEDAPSVDVPEVIVTAQRTPAPVSRTPVAMSVQSGEQLTRAGADTASLLGARLPNVHLDQAADGLRITIRGVSNADATDKGDPSAAFMLDGVYVARPVGQTFGFLDVDRIEVLRGPQGTLYGRNTTAGVVNVISNGPTERLEGMVALEAGTHGSRKLEGVFNVPVSPALALRAALAERRHDPYLKNGQGTPHAPGYDRDERNARLSAKLALGRDASLLVRYDHSEASENNDRFVPDTNFYTGIASGAPAWRAGTTDQRLTNAFRPSNIAPQQGYQDKRARGLSADLRWDLGPATLYYLGARRKLDQDMLQNYYYRITPAFAIGVLNQYEGRNTQDSHELRIATDDQAVLSAQAGIYYFSEESHTVYSFRGLELLRLPPYYVFPSGPTKSQSKAAFGQLTWRLAPGLRLSAGPRATHDDKSRVGSTNFQQGPVFNPATDRALLNAASLATHKTTWRLGAEADLAPATLAYATVATGYKAGGFNDGCIAGASALGIACPAAVAVPADKLYYQPETLRSYEAGLKTRFWNGRATLNAAAFHYDYTNLQLSGVAILQGAPRFITTNAGVASVKGLELDGQLAVGAAGRLSYGMTLLDAHYDRYSPDGVRSWAGRKLDRAPSHVFTLGYDHRFALAGGQLTAGVFARASGAYVIAVPSQLLEYGIPSRTATDATLGYRPDGARWSVLLRARNLENKVQPVAIDSFGMTVPSSPRTVDLRVDYRF